jgi:hypothetical protein
MIFVTWSLASSCWTARNRPAQSLSEYCAEWITSRADVYLGVTADVSGASLTPFSFSALGFSAGTYQHLNNYLFGPTVTASVGRSAVFAHALFGEARSSLGAGVGIPIIGGISTGLTSANAFAMAFGGGIDIGLTRHLAIRAVQVDYLRTQFSASDALTTGLSSSLGNRQNSFRYSIGIVFRF